MQINISSKEKPRREEELEVYSLTYDCTVGAFEMQAGGYLIPPSRPFKPVSLHGQWTTLVVTFEKSEEAQAFCEWLKKANTDAEHSFTRMLD
ncbi:MAG: hypothetical protein ACREXR_05830 [Gammaproteobacteria bacterium]